MEAALCIAAIPDTAIIPLQAAGKPLVLPASAAIILVQVLIAATQGTATIQLPSALRRAPVIRTAPSRHMTRIVVGQAAAITQAQAAKSRRHAQTTATAIIRVRVNIAVIRGLAPIRALAALQLARAIRTATVPAIVRTAADLALVITLTRVAKLRPCAYSIAPVIIQAQLHTAARMLIAITQAQPVVPPAAAIVTAIL